MSDNKQPVLWTGWETSRLIGRGSFGEVYEIERDLFGKKEKAALKYISIPQNDGDIEELYSNGYDDASITAHFKDYLTDIVREYSLMADLKGHPNIVYCDDIRYIQHEDGFGWDVFIKMELLQPLLKTLDKSTSEEKVIRLGKDICNALVLCKGKGIVHRDIKPQNIFVSETGDYKLGDFGIAKMVERTIGGTKIGTYNYMAPEIYNNQPYGTTSDIYSLGLVMYWLLNERRLPFLPLPPKTPTAAETEAARVARFSGKPIAAPKHGSEQLINIVLKACSFDSKERYASAAEMLEALNKLTEKPVVSMPVPKSELNATPVSAPTPIPSPDPELDQKKLPTRIPYLKSAPISDTEAEDEKQRKNERLKFPAKNIIACFMPLMVESALILCLIYYVLLPGLLRDVLCILSCGGGTKLLDNFATLLVSITGAYENGQVWYVTGYSFRVLGTTMTVATINSTYILTILVFLAYLSFQTYRVISNIIHRKRIDVIPAILRVIMLAVGCCTLTQDLGWKIRYWAIVCCAYAVIVVVAWALGKAWRLLQASQWGAISRPAVFYLVSLLLTVAYIVCYNAAGFFGDHEDATVMYLCIFAGWNVAVGLWTPWMYAKWQGIIPAKCDEIKQTSKLTIWPHETLTLFFPKLYAHIQAVSYAHSAKKRILAYSWVALIWRCAEGIALCRVAIPIIGPSSIFARLMTYVAHPSIQLWHSNASAWKRAPSGAVVLAGMIYLAIYGINLSKDFLILHYLRKGHGGEKAH